MSGIPCVHSVQKLEIFDKDSLEVDRETDSGVQRVGLRMPGIMTCDLGLCAPRYPNLRDTMLAMKKPKEMVQLASLGLEEEPKLHVE